MRLLDILVEALLTAWQFSLDVDHHFRLMMNGSIRNPVKFINLPDIFFST